MNNPAPDRDDRRHPEDANDARGGDSRTPTEHDRDRILYCQEFRRLSGITQVISPTGSHPTHNRLTHTLEVAHIAKAMAARLLESGHEHRNLAKAGGLDPVTVEASALAHDIGHPPFGHVTEEVLNRLLRDQESEGFEGNAQSFRILTQLAVRSDKHPGLNLTRATLSAVSKYPWFESKRGLAERKWGAYGSEKDDLEFSRAHLDSSLGIPHSPENDASRTLEAQIMDWADDVAYAVHDVEDFFRVGSIPLDRLKADSEERRRFLEYHFGRVKKLGKSSTASRLEIESQCEALLHKSSPFVTAYDGSNSSRAVLHRQSSHFIHRYILGVNLIASGRNPGWEFQIEPELRIEADLLKSLLWYYVIDHRGLVSLRFGYATLVAQLFETLLDAGIGKHKAPHLFPYPFRTAIEDDDSETNVYRVISDFISSLTEPQTIELHHRLSGITFGNLLDRITY